MFSLTLHPMQPPEITLAECSKRFGERLALRKDKRRSFTIAVTTLAGKRRGETCGRLDASCNW